MRAQFHARVLGQILKLKHENGRDDLMPYFDQLNTRFEKSLQDPALAPIVRFIEQERGLKWTKWTAPKMDWQK